MKALPDEEALFSVVCEEARKLGFDQCAYGLRLVFNVTQPKTVMLNNYPSTWQQRYAEENYLAIDPTVSHGSQSVMPLVWTDDVFRNTRDFWEDARAYSLRYGWAQSCINMQGTRGMLTLARSAEPLSPKELRKNGHRMVWLVQIVHQCMSNLLLNRILPETTIQLSSREKDVLRWTAEGKTAGEIASILNITERTVNFHITHVMEKFNCTNKTAAAVRAALLGLLN
jgi:LuxR family transcriptional regulator